jgi:hypothetical protein
MNMQAKLRQLLLGLSPSSVPIVERSIAEQLDQPNGLSTMFLAGDTDRKSGTSVLFLIGRRGTGPFVILNAFSFMISSTQWRPWIKTSLYLDLSPMLCYTPQPFPGDIKMSKFKEHISDLRARIDELEELAEDHDGVLEFKDASRKLVIAEDAVVQAIDAAETEIDVAEES